MRSECLMERGSATKLASAAARNIVFFVGVLVLSARPAPVHAQTAAGSRPEFEAVSIKPSPPGAQGGGSRVLPSGRLEGRNVTLKYLVTVAYSVTNYQIFGSTDLLENQKYDVIAEAGHPVDTAQLRLMLKTALEDVLKLKVHNETRELPIYSLVPAKPGAKGGGPGLVEDPNGDCAVTSGAAADAANPASPGGPMIPCGNVNLNSIRGQINGRRGRILQLVDRFSTVLRPVVDKTGLTGTYDITLTWTPDVASLPAGANLAPGVDPTGPSIFTAVQEQLGLKLESGKGPVEVIVVDSALKVPQR